MRDLIVDNSDPEAISDVVWRYLLANNSNIGSFGELIKKKLLTVATFIGLK
jgi:hypothetical protein